MDEELGGIFFTDIVVCVNSLYKVRTQKYDVVVLDECGLIRRHLVNSITEKYLRGSMSAWCML